MTNYNRIDDYRYKPAVSYLRTLACPNRLDLDDEEYNLRSAAAGVLELFKEYDALDAQHKQASQLLGDIRHALNLPEGKPVKRLADHVALLASTALTSHRLAQSRLETVQLLQEENDTLRATLLKNDGELRPEGRDVAGTGTAVLAASLNA